MELNETKIKEKLETESLGRTLEIKPTTESTNDDARAAWASGAPHGHVILADAQSGGRGAHGRQWVSPAGCDLYFSIVLRIDCAPAALPLLTLTTGLGVCEALCALTGRDLEIKWPNDILLHGKKCAGILVETATTGRRVETVVVGIGINVNRRTFDDTFAMPATSLFDATGNDFDRNHVLASVLGSLEACYARLEKLGKAAVIAQVERALAWKGKAVEIEGHRGVLLGLSDDGGLRMHTPPGEKRMVTGTLRLAT